MNEKGFTLLEMLLVLLVISALLLLVIPNILSQRTTVQSKGCAALVKSAQSQVQAYHLEKDVYPTIAQLKTEGYISSDTCSNGKMLTIDENGLVEAK